MLILTIFFFIIYLASTAAERYITVRTTRIGALVVCALAWISILTIRSDTLAPWQRLALSCVGLLWLLKLTVLAARQEEVRPLCRPLNEMILRKELNRVRRASQFSRHLLSNIGIVEMDKNVRAGDV